MGMARRYKMQRPSAAALLAMLVLLAASEASAQTASKAAADELFKQAVVLASQGEFEGAAAKFKASYEADPTLGTLLGLAMAEQRCGKLASAYVHYQELLDLARRYNDAEREKEARARMSGIEKDVPRVTITSVSPLPRGARVLLDDVPLPVASLGTAIPVDAGSHVVKVRDSGRDLFQKSMTVSQGEHARVEMPATAVPAAETPTQRGEEPSSGSGLKTAGVVTGAVGLAAVFAGSYLWVRSNQTWNEVSAVCPGASCTPEMRDRIDTGRTQETWSRVALIAGGLGVAGGVTLFAIGSAKKSEPSQETRVMIGPSSVQMFVKF
ncbi:MAG: hypothetical protein HY898_01290 [Deltaproteobacteria bacterium]|nr:hypothetical protein [Deltaproteobacteria bacterium]